YSFCLHSSQLHCEGKWCAPQNNQRSRAVAGPGKQMAAAAAQPIGRKSDPLMHGDLEDPQVSDRLERQPQIIGPMTARAKGYGISDGMKSGFLEDAHRARHMKGGGDDDPALGRLR